jgi:hypothetical protein
MSADNWRVRPLASDFVKVCESPDTEQVFCYSPGLTLLPGGRLVATTDWGGPGVEALPGPKAQRDGSDRRWQGQVYTSDDGGRTWAHRARFPFLHARPFLADESLYVLGQAGDLYIIRSDDGGQTWSHPVALTDGQEWHQAPSNVHYAHGAVYLVMERRINRQCNGWCENAPVLMRARTKDDLTLRESWDFASEMAFCEAVPDRELDWLGVPFYPVYYPHGESVAPGRWCAPIGWLESNVVRFTDSDHTWHDPTGKTLHLWMRAHTGLTNMACILKVTETGEAPGTGAMETDFVRAPSGRKVLFVPCPGGQMKFHVLYDEGSRLYWLLSTQATDSLTRPEKLPPDRFNLPNKERRRVVLHCSRNMWEWCFAGLVDMGEAEVASRHYASMVVDGEDLVVLSRSGDERAINAHDVNMITFHRVRDFRKLVY